MNLLGWELIPTQLILLRSMQRFQISSGNSLKMKNYFRTSVLQAESWAGESWVPLHS